MEVLTSHQAVHHIPPSCTYFTTENLYPFSLPVSFGWSIYLFMFTVIIDMYLLPFC